MALIGTSPAHLPRVGPTKEDQDRQLGGLRTSRNCTSSLESAGSLGWSPRRLWTQRYLQATRAAAPTLSMPSYRQSQRGNGGACHNPPARVQLPAARAHAKKTSFPKRQGKNLTHGIETTPACIHSVLPVPPLPRQQLWPQRLPRPWKMSHGPLGALPGREKRPPAAAPEDRLVAPLCLTEPCLAVCRTLPCTPGVFMFTSFCCHQLISFSPKPAHGSSLSLSAACSKISFLFLTRVRPASLSAAEIASSSEDSSLGQVLTCVFDPCSTGSNRQS